MFAEDIGLLPKDAFLTLLTTHRDDPATLQIMLRCLWADMDSGRGNWKKPLPTLLQTLEALGRAQRQEMDGVITWRA
jgi:hypothetical protein